jgi:hypothetical protein
LGDHTRVVESGAFRLADAASDGYLEGWDRSSRVAIAM